MDSRLRDSLTRRSPHSHLPILGLLLLALEAPGAHAATPAIDVVERRLGLSRVSVQSLHATSRSVRIPIDLQGRRVTVSLAPHSLRAPGFRLRIASHGTLHDAPVPPAHTVRGTVEELPGSVVGGTIRDGQIRLAIALADRRDFYVQPLADVETGVDPALHAVYAAEDAIGDDGRCAAAGDGEAVPPGSNSDPGTSSVAVIRTAEIAFDTDWEFYAANGSSENATVADIENVLAQVNAVYERDVELTHVVTTIIVRADPADPYTTSDAGDLFDEFATHWVASQSAVPRDVAHLMTGRTLDNGTIGIASVGAICSKSRGYGLSQSRFSGNLSRRCALTAHELGHNWNARHCDAVSPCTIMCSSLGGCDGIGAPNFEPMAIEAITSYAATRTCLQTPQVSVEPGANTGLQFAAPTPTPFTEEAALGFQLPREVRATLEIYDVAGHRVAQLMDGVRPAGWHTVTWNGRDEGGRTVDAGVYYARLGVNGTALAQKLVRLR